MQVRIKVTKKRKVEKGAKTYNTGVSPVVTGLSTNPAATGHVYLANPRPWRFLNRSCTVSRTIRVI